MKFFLSSCLTIVFTLAGVPAQATGPYWWWSVGEPFVLLDDFKGDRIDASIWHGNQPNPNVLDFAREVARGKLRLMTRAFGDPDAVPGRGGRRGQVRVLFNNGDAVTQIAALVRVNALELNDCVAPAIVSEVGGRVDGFFFTTEGPPGALDATRNIQPEIRFRRLSNSVDPPGVMRVEARVFQCGDSTCTSGTSLFVDSNSLGTLSLRQPTLLRLLWDPDNDRFIFLRDFAMFTIYDYTNILTDADPASTDLDFVARPRFEARVSMENCASGPAASGFVDLSVDKVWVNQSALSP